MSVSNIPPSNLLASQLLAPGRPRTSTPPAPPSPPPPPSGSNATVGTTSLFQQLSSDLQSFFVQLQSSRPVGPSAGPEVAVARTPTTGSTATPDSDGDDDASPGSPHSLVQPRRSQSDTQETGGADAFQAEANPALNAPSGLANAVTASGSATNPTGSASQATSFFAAIQAYAAAAGQSAATMQPGDK